MSLSAPSLSAASTADAWSRAARSLAELRAATSFAGLLPDQGHAADATALLQPVYDQFIEGFDTADLKPQKHCSTNCVS